MMAACSGVRRRASACGGVRWRAALGGGVEAVALCHDMIMIYVKEDAAAAMTAASVGVRRRAAACSGVRREEEEEKQWPCVTI